MSFKNNRLQVLLKSLTDNEISKEELEELAELLKTQENDSAVFSEMESLWANLSADESTGIDKETFYSSIIADPRFKQPVSKENVIRLNKKSNLFSYAAAILLICSVGLGLYYFKGEKEYTSVQNLSIKQDSVGQISNSNKAILKLSDGREIVLDQVSNGELVKENSAVISKTDDGQIAYNLSNLSQENNNNQLVFNTIITPKGGNYQIILPDGTKVWLNAMSSLKFPTVFSEKERSVELTGEGYFEVVKNKTKPFFVKASGIKIEVLGTHFNVAAYSDDLAVKTTLLEGSVKVDSRLASATLKPGQQAVLQNSSSQINVNEVSIDDVMAWKSGYFIFRNESIQNIMKKISRWYDIDVSYEGDLSGKKFGGKYLKNNTLSELLKSLELTGTINFKIDGRRVTVMQ